MDVNFNTYMGGGGLVFALFFTNRKSGTRAIRVEIFIPAYTEKISNPGVLISELADYLIFSICPAEKERNASVIY